jgi:putative hydrolase of the HAD superfamily
MIQNIVFDMGGVLVDVHRDRAVAHFEAIGVDKADELIDACHHSGIFLDVESGDIDADEFCRQLCMEAGKDIPKDAIFKAWRSIIDPPPLYKLDFLLELKRRYRTFLLSNNNPILVNNWSMTPDFSEYGRPIAFYFEQCFFSYELHCVKPGAEIFRLMTAQSGIDPAVSLYLDDSADNIAAAANEGFVTMLVENGSDWRQQLLERL